MNFFALLLFCLVYNLEVLKSQDIVLTRFYDSAWIPVNRDSAFYFCDFKKHETLYLCECYWKSTENLKAISMKEHLNLYSKSIGLDVTYFKNNKVEKIISRDENGKLINTYSYYENGQLADSIFFNEDEKVDSGFHYYENGKIRALYFFDEKTKAESLAAYNRNGEKMNISTYLVEAHFKNDETDWLNYIKQNLSPLTAVNNNAPKGEYTVIVKFSIEKDGSISNIKAETNYGYGMEEAVINLIRKSSKWKPEVFLGEPKVVSRRQPITFVVSE